MNLLDINVWIALTFDQHQKHTSARAWFEGLPEGSRSYFCRYTQMGFLRLMTNPNINPNQTQTMSRAWVVYDYTRNDPRVGYAAEPDGLQDAWRQISQRDTFSHKLWNDAYLAAFAISGGYEVVTFDQGFAQFAGLQSIVLS